MKTEWPVIWHRNFRDALERAYQAAIMAAPGDCILITGPTGIGKTTILPLLIHRLVGAPSEWSEGELRAFQVNCDRVAPSSATRSIALKINRKLGNPFVSLKTSHEKSEFAPIRIPMNEDDLRESARVIAALQRTMYGCIDGLENIVPKQRVTGTARFDAIKSLGLPHERGDIPPHQMRLIMCGHYSLLQYWTENAQLARRVTEIPLYPYSHKSSDVKSWEYILQQISPLYPLREGISLRDWNDLLFHMSIGCTGILKKVLDDAHTIMNLRGDPFLELDHVIKSAFPKIKMEAVQNDIHGFSKYFESSLDQGLIAKVKARALADGPVVLHSTKKARPGRKVGQRDKVGAI